MAEPFKTAGLHGSVWAINCESCGAIVRMGPGAKAGIQRLLALVGPFCDSCRAAVPGGESNG